MCIISLHGYGVHLIENPHLAVLAFLFPDFVPTLCLQHVTLLGNLCSIPQEVEAL